MTRQQRLAQNGSAARGRSAGAPSSITRAKGTGADVGSGRRKRAKRVPSKQAPKKKSFALQTMEITDLYRPLKKPVTLRLDADVLAWFKKEGSRYQTRINSALRKIMEREMKEK